jgi:hypothetical protein
MSPSRATSTGLIVANGTARSTTKKASLETTGC